MWFVLELYKTIFPVIENISTKLNVKTPEEMPCETIKYRTFRQGLSYFWKVPFLSDTVRVDMTQL